ncbi:hypothetical protein JV174_16965, partial [Pseudomonas sp. SDM007_2]|uniref:hypothetical protein n=1 Tax=Pseudomonas hygromyciniae TaxID=2812000 RepID=UPI0019672947
MEQVLHHTKNAETLCIELPERHFKWVPTASRAPFAFLPPKTKPQMLSQLGFRNLILTMTYSHMGKPHTTIGDAS